MILDKGLHNESGEPPAEHYVDDVALIRQLISEGYYGAENHSHGQNEPANTAYPPLDHGSSEGHVEAFVEAFANEADEISRHKWYVVTFPSQPCSY